MSVNLITNKARLSFVENTRVKKGKEAEDLDTKIQKTISVNSFECPDLSSSKIAHKIKSSDIASKTAEIWECRDRVPNKLGGYIYVFQMKNAFDPIDGYKALREKAEEIYPANEVINPNGLKFMPVHEAVGFQRTGSGKETLLYLPDREALMANWEKCRETNPGLPALTIISDDGISSDDKFILSYFTHDVLLSTGKQFFHDCLLHVAPTLAKMWDLKDGDAVSKKPSFKSEKVMELRIIAKIYRTILIAIAHVEKNSSSGLTVEDLKNVMFVLSYIVDSFSSARLSPARDKDWVHNTLRTIWDNPAPLMKQYLKRRFGRDKLSNVAFSVIWSQIQEIEAQQNIFAKTKQGQKQWIERAVSSIFSMLQPFWL